MAKRCGKACLGAALVIAGAWVGAASYGEGGDAAKKDRPAEPILVVTKEVEAHSEKLLAQVLMGIEENRKKLRTVDVEAVMSFEHWNGNLNEWADAGKVEGRVVAEAADPRRVRCDISLHKMVWTDGAAPFVQESYIETWDGKKTRRLHRPPHSSPRGIISNHRQLQGEWAGGGMFSLQLLRHAGFGDDKDVRNLHPLDAALLEKMRLVVRRVVLNGKQAAVELEVGFPPESRIRQAKRYWFDGARGYGLLGMWETRDGVSPDTEWAVDEMLEAAPGIFYPSQGRYVVGGKQPIMRGAFKATKVAVNEQVDESIYEIAFPPGVKVWEQREGTSQPATQR
jgi:hypothetical protein